MGEEIYGAYRGSFVCLSKNGYAKDDKKAYYFGKEISGIESKSFISLDGGYPKDKNNVYFNGEEVVVLMLIIVNIKYYY